jgi:Ca2+-binding EF-hand superfamily protein
MMKKKIMLVVLFITVGVMPIVTNAKEDNSFATSFSSIYLHDIDEDGLISYKDVLDYVALTKVSQYEEGTEQSKELWSIHEEAKKLSNEKAKEILDQIILNY